MWLNKTPNFIIIGHILFKVAVGKINNKVEWGGGGVKVIV